MKKAGFTLIELIFVIVILGILALVALPKLTGVKEQADEGVIKSFVGTLNHTVGPTKWSKSIADGDNGSIKNSKYDINATDTDFPAGFTTAVSKVVDTSKCETVNATKVTATTNIAARTTDNKYYIVCRDGSTSQAPRFWYMSSVPAVDDTLDDTKIKLK